MHRYTYTENNRVNRTDPSGHLTGAPPCNLLPNRPDTCTWEDVQRWWQSEDGEQARQAGAAAARTPYDGIVGFWDFVGHLGSDPRGAINGALYSLIDTPYQIGGDLLAGTVCGNGPRFGRGMGNGSMVYLSTMRSAQRMLDTMLDRPPPMPPRLPDEEPPPRLPRLPCGPNSFSADTLVATEDGLRPINTITIGDLVLAYDEATQSTGFFTVTAVISHTDPAILQLTIDDTMLETTSEHPFYTWERGWVNAGQLHSGEHIHQANNSYGIVRSVAVI